MGTVTDCTMGEDPAVLPFEVTTPTHVSGGFDFEVVLSGVPRDWLLTGIRVDTSGLLGVWAL